MSSKPINVLLYDLPSHAKRAAEAHARSKASDGSRDQQLKDAVLWNLLVIGEICTRFDSNYQSRNPEIPWASIIGLRNILARGYDIVEWEIIDRVVIHEIPRLIDHAERLLREFGPPPQD